MDAQKFLEEDAPKATAESPEATGDAQKVSKQSQEAIVDPRKLTDDF